MPELPDISAYITALEPRVIGEPIEHIRVASPFLLRTAVPPLSSVEGKKIVELRRLGKRICFGLEGDLWLVLHPFSMTAKELRTNLTRLQLKAVVYRLWVLINGFSLNILGKQLHWPGNETHYETWQTSKAMRGALWAAGFDHVRISHGKHFVVTARRRTR